MGEIFAGRIKNVKSTLTSTSTIERVNEDLMLISSRKPLGPTTDQDLFAYRTNVEIGNFRRTYKVEFGDFPGEDSLEYAEKYGPWLHNTEFFKWVLFADSLVFVIDVGDYLLKLSQGESDEFVARMSSAIRATWQNYVNTREGGAKVARRTPVIIVFTKVDIPLRMIKTGDILLPKGLKITNIESFDIEDYGLGDFIPQFEDFSDFQEEQMSLKIHLFDEFQDLIIYLSSETKYVDFILTSCFGTVDGEKIGIPHVLNGVLPQR